MKPTNLFFYLAFYYNLEFFYFLYITLGYLGISCRCEQFADRGGHIL
jgi:hypothetical protein